MSQVAAVQAARAVSQREITIKYSYGDVPTIKDFAKSNAALRGLMGPFASGKSSGCVIELVKRGLAQVPGPDGIRRTRWAVVRNTYRQLQDTTIKTFHQWFPPAAFGEWRVSDQRFIITAFENAEIEILFRALDRPDQIGNLLSLELTGAWVNEAREVPWAIIEALQARTGRFPAKRDGSPTWSGVFMDTNPPDVDSRWFKFFEEPHDPPLPENFSALFRQPSGLAENAENLTNIPMGRAYYERLAAGKDAEWVKVYVHGEYGFVIDGKPVFPEYNDQTHCTKGLTPVEGHSIYRGWDWGLTPACVFVQITPKGQVVVLDELCADDMGVDQFSERVIAHSIEHYYGFNFRDIGDPAGGQRSQVNEQTVFQMLHAKGIEVQPGPQAPSIRIESVKKLLRSTAEKGAPKFLIDARAKTLRKALQGGYQYRRLQVSEERYTNEPNKNVYSHPADALQYVAGHLFGGTLTNEMPRTDDLEDESLDIFAAGRSPVTGY